MNLFTRKLAVISVLIASIAGVDTASAATGETTIVSKPQGAVADNYSNSGAVSADGRFLAFTSKAKNLSEDDGDMARDVFVRDMREETIILVSRSTGQDGAGGQTDSFAPSISADGRFVAFASHEDNFTDADAPGIDVFVRDLKEGTTTFVSRESGVSGEGGESASQSPSISADGRYVAFESNADNLSGAAQDVGNIFVRDLEKDRTTLVSRRTGKNGTGGDASSQDPSISADGTRVAFDSRAENLSGADDDTFSDVFVRDLSSGETALVSRKSGTGADANNDAVDAAISANGKHVAFESGANNLAPDFPPLIYGIFVRDLSTGRTVLASRRTSGGIAKDNSNSPSISSGGRFVAFESTADNLSRDDDNLFANVYVRDLEYGRTTLASRASGPKSPGADGHSTQAAISANGRYVAFTSEAYNLSVGDSNAYSDIFRRDLRQRKGVG